MKNKFRHVVVCCPYHTHFCEYNYCDLNSWPLINKNKFSTKTTPLFSFFSNYKFNVLMMCPNKKKCIHTLSIFWIKGGSKIFMRGGLCKRDTSKFNWIAKQSKNLSFERLKKQIFILRWGGGGVGFGRN